MYSSLLISNHETTKPKPEQIFWGKNGLKCFNDLDEDILYLIAKLIATCGTTSPREPNNRYALGNPDIPYDWFSPDLWRFRLISPACAAIGKSVWIGLSVSEGGPMSDRLSTRRGRYTALHLPPRCEDLHVLKRIICDGELSKIVKEVIYHIHPVYKDLRLEEHLRTVLNKESPIIQRLSNTRVARMNADLMIRQQAEQSAFVVQASSPDGYENLKVIFGALGAGISFRVKTLVSG